MLSQWHYLQVEIIENLANKGYQHSSIARSFLQPWILEKYFLVPEKWEYCCCCHKNRDSKGCNCHDWVCKEQIFNQISYSVLEKGMSLKSQNHFPSLFFFFNWTATWKNTNLNNSLFPTAMHCHNYFAREPIICTLHR